MSISGWQDFESREIVNSSDYMLRFGGSISGIINKKINEKSTLLFIPRAGVALHVSSISGYGLGFSSGIQYRINNKVSVYGAAGFVYGFETFRKKENGDKELKTPSGLGIIFNLGASSFIYKNLGWNFELAPIYSMNFFDNRQHFVVSPQLGISYLIFQPKSKIQPSSSYY